MGQDTLKVCGRQGGVCVKTVLILVGEVARWASMRLLAAEHSVRPEESRMVWGKRRYELLLRLDWSGLVRCLSHCWFSDEPVLSQE